MGMFEIAHSITAKIEGGYVNDPTDNGGETYAGIARKFWPAEDIWHLIDAMKKMPGFPNNLNSKSRELHHLLKLFYKKNFWDAIRLPEIGNQSIANEVYDSAVNCGNKKAVIFLQEALNVTNNNQQRYRNLKVDGVIGPITIATVNTHFDQTFLFNVLNILQGEHYLNICRNREDQEKFLRGWFTRVEKMK